MKHIFQIENKPHPWRARTATTDENADQIDKLTRDNHHITIWVLTLFDSIIRKDLQISESVYKWIFRFLTDKHEKTRLQIAYFLLDRYEHKTEKAETMFAAGDERLTVNAENY